MTIAYWCVLAAILLPYIWTGVAKFTSGFHPRDNHNPREYLEKLDGSAKRANWAQLNTFESIPGFMDAIAVTYIALRLVYGVLYIMDKAALRSLVWAGGVACIVALFVVSA